MRSVYVDVASIAGPLPGLRQVIRAGNPVADVSIPKVCTKQLALNRLQLPDGSVRRRLRLSSNFLPLAGFTAESRFSAAPIGPGKGLQIRFSPEGGHKVHVRSYSRRVANPFETHIDLQSQSLIDQAIPAFVEACRWEIREGEIRVLPLPNRVFSIGRSMRRRPLSERLEAFVGLTSGCDIALMEAEGFTVRGVLEYRPNEARDKRDRSESGALNALANGRHIQLLSNEDIFAVDWERIASQLGARDGVIACLHASAACDDFSPLKCREAREASINNLTSTIDMVVPIIRGVEALMPATVVVENVPAFLSSQGSAIFALQMRRLGYHVTAEVLNGADYGGLTSRRRAYLVASIWPGFAFPEPTGRNVTPIHDVLADMLPHLRDVTDTSSFRKGREVGRSRIIAPGATVSPTVTKSQPRMAKDSVTIQHGERYRFIDGAATKRLMGLQMVNTELVNADLEAEILGQSVEGPMHAALMRAVRQHILSNTGSPALAVNARLL